MFATRVYTPFRNRETLDKHVPFCSRHDPQQVIYPTGKESVLKFRAFQKQHPAPFYLVCDFESFLVPVEEGDKRGGLLSSRHTPGVGILLLSSHGLRGTRKTTLRVQRTGPNQ